MSQLPQYIDIHQLLKKTDNNFTTVYIDVRSEAEYHQAHIIGAVNIPILNNEERKIIGKLYVKEGKEKAIMKGYELIGPKFHLILKKIKTIAFDKNIVLYCWRGGMRSLIMEWLCSTMGWKTLILNGGYKSYRKAMLEVLNNKYKFKILSGATGSGKTEILQQLSKYAQVIDLEEIAIHKGSVYGQLHTTLQQPSQEQFENKLAEKLLSFNKDTTIWLEAESRLIGRCAIPDPILAQMDVSDHIQLNVEMAIRAKRIATEYAHLPIDKLIEATSKLQKRMGGQNVKQAIAYLQNNQIEKWILMMLSYYDKTYIYAMTRRRQNNIKSFTYDGIDSKHIISYLLSLD